MQQGCIERRGYVKGVAVQGDGLGIERIAPDIRESVVERGGGGEEGDRCGVALDRGEGIFWGAGAGVEVYEADFFVGGAEAGWVGGCGSCRKHDPARAFHGRCRRLREAISECHFGARDHDAGRHTDHTTRTPQPRVSCRAADLIGSAIEGSVSVSQPALRSIPLRTDSNQKHGTLINSRPVLN